MVGPYDDVNKEMGRYRYLVSKRNREAGGFLRRLRIRVERFQFHSPLYSPMRKRGREVGKGRRL